MKTKPEPVKRFKAGAILWKQRRMRNLTRREVAIAAGITEMTLLQIEHGRSVPGSDTLARIAAVIKMNVEELFQ